MKAIRSRDTLSSVQWAAGHIGLLFLRALVAWFILASFETSAVIMIAALVGFEWVLHKALVRLESFSLAEAKALSILLGSAAALGFMVSNLFFHEPGISGYDLIELCILTILTRGAMTEFRFDVLVWKHGFLDPDEMEIRLDERQAAINSRALLLGALCFAGLMVIFIFLVELGFGKIWFSVGHRGWLTQCMAIVLAISGMVYGFTALRYYAADRMDDDGLFWKAWNFLLSALPAPRDIRR